MPQNMAKCVEVEPPINRVSIVSYIGSKKRSVQRMRGGLPTVLVYNLLI